MDYSKDFRRKIFDKTTGRCHLCGGGIFFNNYGAIEKKGAWEIEHSVPRSKGGTDHLNNLFPAHIDCNRSKSNHSTRTARAKYGRTRAPYSEKKATEVRLENTFVGGGAGFLAGLLLRLTNPGLALITLIGSTIGYLTDPED